jgi:hypothetical protein
MTKHVRVTKQTCGCEAYPFCEHAIEQARISEVVRRAETGEQISISDLIHRKASVKTETPQANPLLCCLESAAIRAGFNIVLVGQSVMLRNLAVVLREDTELCLEIERRMVKVLNSLAKNA